MQNKKYSERDGYGIYTTDFQATDSRLAKMGHTLAENSIEILMIALFAGMVVATGMLLQTTALAADSMIEYVELTEHEQDYQLQQIVEALAHKQAEEAVGNAVLGGEIPKETN